MRVYHYYILISKTITIKWLYRPALLVLLCTFHINAFSQNEQLIQLESELKDTKDDSLRIIRIIHFTRELHRRDHRENKEYKYAREAIDIGLKINDTLLYALALDNLGLLYRYHEWYAQAIPLHIKASQLVNNREVPPIYKMIFANNAGLAARYDQQYDLSIKYYIKALKIAVDENNLKNIAISNNGLGNALSNIPGKEEEALDHFKRALKAEREKNDSLGIAMDLLSISDYYINNGNYTNALHYLDTLYVINKLRKDPFGLAITNQFYGRAHFKENKNIQKAKDYYLKALDQFRELNNKTKEAQLLRELGSLYQKTNNSNTALIFFLQSLKMADSIRNKELISKNAYSISAIKEQQRKYSEALSYYKKAKSYEDSIALSRQKIKVAALTNQYKLDQKESKINLLQSENLLREEQIIAQKEKILIHKIYFILLIAFILFILLFVFLQYRNRKAKRHAEQLLHKNREELLKARYEKNIAQAEMLATRTQLNPHFLFNSLSAIHLLIQKGQTKKAAQYLIVLSRFFRMILELPKSNIISLEEELKLIRYYITLEEKRFEDNFHFKLQALHPEEMDKIQIPPLLLQPFVENAIWHGLLPSEKPIKFLNIHITKQGPEVHIIIEDNGVGRRNHSSVPPSDHAKDKKSLGMKITRDRIEQFNKSYNHKINLNIIDQMEESGQRGGTKVVLILENGTEPISNHL